MALAVDAIMRNSVRVGTLKSRLRHAVLLPFRSPWPGIALAVAAGGIGAVAGALDWLWITHLAFWAAVAGVNLVVLFVIIEFVRLLRLLFVRRR